MKQVNVTVWSDFVCPWCWIAKRRLESAAKSVDQQVAVVFNYKSYRLGRGASPVDYREAIARKLGGELVASKLIEAVSAQAEHEGLTYNFDRMLFGDTTLAHAVVKSVENPAEQHRLIELLSVESITNGRNIFDSGVLSAIATEAGVPAESLKLDDKDVLDSIAQDEQDANQVSSGVPLFVFNDRTYVSGAQPFEVFVQALLKVAEDSPYETSDESADGARCSTDGCRI